MTIGQEAGSDELAKMLLEASTEGTIPCPAALEIARKTGESPLIVGRTLDDLGIKLVQCQLGCFR